MAKQKGLRLEDEYSLEITETIDSIKNDLDKLDSIEINVPDDHWFEQFVLQQQSDLRAKFRRELGWFFVAALLILTGLVFTLIQLPYIFLAIQAGAILVAVLFIVKGNGEKVNQI